MLARRSLALTLVAVAAVPMLATAASAQDTRPTVAVLYFDNNSIGRDAADYAGIGKGIADLLITDLASNASVRVVERERLQAVLQEQDLVRQGAIDPQIAVRLGKLLGVRHMITGGFMNTGSRMVLTARTIDVETAQISNPQRVEEAGDDVLGLIAGLSGRLTTSLKLAPAGRQTGDAGEHAGHGAMQPSQGAAPHGSHGAMQQAHGGGQHAAAGHAAADHAIMNHGADSSHRHDAGHQHDPSHHPAQPAAAPAAAKPAAAPATATPATRAPSPTRPAKLDLRTALLYSKALEAQDAGDRARAVELYDQVLSRYPDMRSARTNRDRLAASGD